MRRSLTVVTALLLAGAAAGAWIVFSLGSAAEPPPPAPRSLTDAERESLPRPFQALEPLHEPLSAPKPGEWLDRHKEAGQNYREYLAAGPVRASGERRTIYVQPLGDFTPDQRRIVGLAAEFLAAAFQLPVIVVRGLAVERRAGRGPPRTRNPQILSTYVLDNVLKPSLPADAVTYLGLTATDLWPGEGWNFVFGQASLADRVGVWSLYRFGDPGASEDAFRLALLRTLKTSVHETGHMFSLPHCVHFEWVMCGSNYLQESDRRPLAFCPQCLAKLAHATGADPRRQLEACARFAETNGLKDEGAFWRKSLGAMGGAAR